MRPHPSTLAEAVRWTLEGRDAFEVLLDESGLLLAESPIAFRRRRIFTQAEPLRRARMPAG